MASTRPMSPTNSSSTLVLPMVQSAFGPVPMTFQREPSSLAAEALVEAEVSQAMVGYRKGGVGKRRAAGSSPSSRTVTSSSNRVLTVGGGEGDGLSFFSSGVNQLQQQQQPLQPQPQPSSVHNPHFRSLAPNLTLASRKHASLGDEVHAQGLEEGTGPVVAQRGEDDRYLRLVHLGRDGKAHRRRHYHTHVTRAPLKSSGAGGLGVAHNTTSVLTHMARVGAQADVVTEMVGDVLLKVKALERDEREVLEALAKEAGRDFDASAGIGEGKVKALRSDTSMAAVISQMEAQFQKEDEMEDLAVKVIVQERALAEIVEKNEGREKARQEYLETLEEEEEEEGHNDEDEDEDEDEFFDGGSAAGGSVSSYGGGSATGSATSATSAMSYHRRKKGGRKGGGRGGAFNSFSHQQQHMVLSHSSSSLASLDSFAGRPSSPALNQASQVDFLLAQTPKGFPGGGGSATGGSVRSRSSSPLKGGGPSTHHIMLSSSSSATSFRGLSPPSRRAGGGGSSSSSVGRGRSAGSPRRRNGSPSPPPPPTPPPKPFNLVDEAKRAMAVKETPTQIRQREAEAAEIERREALLTSRPSMTRGETWHGARPLHPLTAQAIKNGMKVDPDGEAGGGAIVASGGGGGGAAATAADGALATVPGSSSRPLNAGAGAGAGGGMLMTRESGGADRGSPSSSSSPIPPPPIHPLEKSHLQNTGFCNECDDYIRRALAEQFGYKVAGVVMRAATVQESTQEEVEREITRASVEALPTAKRRVPMDPKLGAGPLDRAKLLKRERVAAKAREESAAQRSTAFAAHAAHTAHVNATLVPNEPLSRQVRYVAYGDKWVEDYDDETGRTFYYNVVDGARQWNKPPLQHWDLAEGGYTPLTPPTVFPKTNEGELEAARVEKVRLEKATARALAQGRVVYERQQGLGPKSLAGVDVGPASAKVLPGSFRVMQRGRE